VEPKVPVVAAVLEDFETIHGVGGSGMRDVEHRDAATRLAQHSPERPPDKLPRRHRSALVGGRRDGLPAMETAKRHGPSGEEARPQGTHEEPVGGLDPAGCPPVQQAAKCRELACGGHIADDADFERVEAQHHDLGSQARHLAFARTRAMSASKVAPPLSRSGALAAEDRAHLRLRSPNVVLQKLAQGPP